MLQFQLLSAMQTHIQNKQQEHGASTHCLQVFSPQEVFGSSLLIATQNYSFCNFCTKVEDNVILHLLQAILYVQQLICSALQKYFSIIQPSLALNPLCCIRDIWFCYMSCPHTVAFQNPKMWGKQHAPYEFPQIMFNMGTHLYY